MPSPFIPDEPVLQRECVDPPTQTVRWGQCRSGVITASCDAKGLGNMVVKEEGEWLVCRANEACSH